MAGEFPDPSNDGGYTKQQFPSDNDGGFTSETVFQQNYVSDQPISNQPISNKPVSKNDLSSWETPEGSYLTQRPPDYDKLKDMGTVSGSDAQTTSAQDQNRLWIIDLAGFNRYPEINVPQNSYVKEEITPILEGQINLEEIRPDGEIRSYSMSYVYPRHVYNMWFYGDLSGTYTIRYNINGNPSNIVKFYVQGGQSQGSYTQEASLSTTTTSSANKVVRIGGATGSNPSAMNANGGSNVDESTDPAIAFCIKRGNIYENGKCTFPGGSSCDVWDFYAGNCILTGKPRR